MKEMKLQDFISGVITEIIDGIVLAQGHAEKVGAKINPILSGEIDPGFYYFHEPTGKRQFGQLIEFDVSVTTAESEEAKGGIGLFAGAIGFGSQAQFEGSRSDLARVRFQIPVIFPVQK